jgi:hypothetical protein
VLYHPLVFKTVVCEGSRSNESGECDWGGKFCPKAHTTEDPDEDDLHVLQDFGLREVYLESTLADQLECNRRVAANAATYKASVTRVISSRKTADSQLKKPRKQRHERPGDLSRSAPAYTAPDHKPATPVKQEPSRGTNNCFKCKAAMAVFVLQCKHGLCSACLDVECCPVCNP